MKKFPANFVGLVVAAFALASVSAHYSIPLAYAAATTTTTTLSANTTFSSLVVGEGDTLVINPGVEVGAQTIINNGTIINRGSLVAGTFVNEGTMDIHGMFAFTGEGSNDGGTVNVYGTLRFEGVSGDFYNKDGGVINVKENARFEFWRQGSYRPHDLYNGANSLVDNYGAVALTGYTGMRILNEGTLYEQCTGTYTVPVTGNSIVDKCAPSKQEHTLAVKTTGLGSSAISGMWTVIRAGDGTVVKTGYTPLAFTGPAGEYRIKVSNYDGRIFSSWEDGSTNRERKITLSADATITARYDPGNSLRGYTGLTFTGTQEQPDLAVKAVKTGGNQELRIWTIIDPQTTDASGTTYKVFVHSYKDRVFDHWEDGSTSRIRILTIDENTAITAYYKTG
jgi:hypothetical protein